MPCEKEMLKLIPKIYKRNAEEIGLYFWVKAQLNILPTMSVDMAIKSFLRYTNSEEWDVQSARTTYNRMQNDYYCK